MVYSKKIVGKFVDLRSITIDDAEFSFRIRSNEKNRNTVGQLAESVDAQRLFIERQRVRPNDYYFVVQNKLGESIGLIGAYDIHDGIGEVGREVNEGEPAEILEAEILINDFCKEILNLDRVCFVVYPNNIHHIKDLKKRGAKFVRFEQRGGYEALYFEQDLKEINPIAEKTKKILDRLFARQTARMA